MDKGLEKHLKITSKALTPEAENIESDQKDQNVKNTCCNTSQVLCQHNKLLIDLTESDKSTSSNAKDSLPGKVVVSENKENSLSADSQAKSDVQKGNNSALSPTKIKPNLQICPEAACNRDFPDLSSLYLHITNSHSLKCRVPNCTYSTFDYLCYLSHTSSNCSYIELPKKRKCKADPLSEPHKEPKLSI